ncbi:MAG: HAD-IIIC family phosphatase [Phocaeicola sp.]|uniref:HAD-IIIC family phosphatase n=1 Tax=Phocaeicola TaxID=909656 RepID=UPI00234EBF02|nr:HAD-IIIC family phosphatase [Phocaeicola oris]MCE2617200.1 HAD-IIIC family phosphatase [Phocaeicola oris]
MLINSQDLDLTKIKLVIWDLDNTFWKGIISEEPIHKIPEYAKLVKDLSLHGVVNSICSKNTFEVCENKLKEMEIWDYFVFPSIDWTPKGKRVLNIVKDMGLRPANVLFLDDEPYNLQYVNSLDPSIVCSDINSIYHEIEKQISKLPLNESMKRLKQYQDLQIKVASSKDYDSAEDFLRACNIKLQINKNCEPQIDRITELIGRTNQLNFTKKRIDKSQVGCLIRDVNYECGYIHVIDKFCDYGIIGFYALQKTEHKLEHFLFSCRTIGMGIEQYVYSFLKYPKLDVSGEVVNQLEKNYQPDWIQLIDFIEKLSIEKQTNGNRILIKGPCDVSQVVPFFKDQSLFDTEFSYISKIKSGTYIEAQNHSSQILLSHSIDASTRKELIDTLPFIDEEYFSSRIFSKQYDYVIYSILPDYGLGLYRNKKNPLIILPYNQYTIDYTQKDSWMSILHDQSTLSDEEILHYYQYFKDNYEFIGRISDDDMIKNLTQIRHLLSPSTMLIIQNGAELPYKGEYKKGYEGREVLHHHLNRLLENFIESHDDNCFLLDVNTCIDSNNSYLDTINHFKKNVYYKIAQTIQQYVSSNNEERKEFKVRGWYAVYVDNMKKIYFKIKAILYPIYSKLKKL